jgi:uncharacterized cupin superfamily protein/GNAT superfamily N-acetyltransferase
MIVVRKMNESDIALLYQAFKGPLWNKQRSQYEKYFSEQKAGARIVLLGLIGECLAGYVTIVWTPEYEPFRTQGVPEIKDLNTLHEFRKRGVGTALISAAENACLAADRLKIGIGVGLTPDYGSAQRLYPKLGYVPDGLGATSENELMMTKVLSPQLSPIINLDELEYVSDGPGLPGKHAPVGNKIGAKKLGYNVSVCPPGKSVCPLHNHRVNEEMFFILEGEGILRFGERTFPLRKGDFVACPPGGREVAHQMINSGKVDLKYISLSTEISEEICEYPDSNKVGVFIGDYQQMKFRKIFRADSDVPYAEGETADVLWEKK